MAERRMFTQKIVDSDAFLDMPLSTQALYFHLNMRADDDGFINNPKKIQRMIGCCDDDLKLLIAKRFIIAFETGVVVIKHWRMHNLLRKDRYNPTQYQEEMTRLMLKDNGSYTESLPILDNVATTWQPNDNQMATQDSIGKDSIDKYSKENDRKEDKPKETFVSLIESYTTDPLLVSALKDYVEMRKKMKGYTTHALKLNLNTLSKLATIDATKVEIVNQSIEHSWKSFYELKIQPKKEVVPEWYGKEEKVEESKEDELEKLRIAYQIYKTTSRFEKAKEIQEKYFELTGKDIEKEI
jgi:hypothetical protein